MSMKAEIFCWSYDSFIAIVRWQERLSVSHMLTELVFHTHIHMVIHSLYKGTFVNVCGECVHTYALIITDVILALAAERDRRVE